MSEEKDLFSNLMLELRRGTLVLSVLSQIKEKRYGYSLVQSLEEKGISIDPNTLYPLLRRLEKQGLLSSEWDVAETKPRKYYSRTPMGEDVYEQLRAQWKIISNSIEVLVRED